MPESSDFDWWGHYDHVIDIAEEARTSVKPIFLDLAGKITIPQAIDVLKYKVLTGKALILTRFEGYAFNSNSTAAVILTPPLQDVFPWTPDTGMNPGPPQPSFQWLSRTDALVDTIVMPPRPQSCLDQNCLLTFPENATAVFRMSDLLSPAGSIYGWSFRAWAWLIPAGKITNFQLIQTNYNTNFTP